MATAVETSPNGSVDYSKPTGLRMRGNAILAGAVEKQSAKTGKPYYQVLVEPEAGGQAVYVFASAALFTECAAILKDAGAAVPGVVTLIVSRSGENLEAFSPGEVSK